MRFLLALFMAFGFSLHSAYAEKYCAGKIGTALVLAIDSSDSIDAWEWNLEMRGYVDAFRHPEVIDAILLSSPCNRVAVTVLFWARQDQQDQAIPWRVLDSPKSIKAFAAELDKAKPRFSEKKTTALAAAIRRSVKLFETVPALPIRKIIDVSGDGLDDLASDKVRDQYRLLHRSYTAGSVTNVEYEPFVSMERDYAAAQGITINGLAVSTGDENDVRRYYEDNLKTPDGFVYKAEGFEDFAVVLRRKLVTELAMAQ